MPWRVLFGLKDLIILNGNKPRYKKLLLFKIFSVFCQQQYFFCRGRVFCFTRKISRGKQKKVISTWQRSCLISAGYLREERRTDCTVQKTQNLGRNENSNVKNVFWHLIKWSSPWIFPAACYSSAHASSVSLSEKPFCLLIGLLLTILAFWSADLFVFWLVRSETLIQVSETVTTAEDLARVKLGCDCELGI